MKSTLQLSIIIETTNISRQDEDHLREVLSALKKQSASQDCFEVIVVIDTEDHPNLFNSMKEWYPKAKLLEVSQSHYYRQKNLGAFQAKAPIIAFLDSDCIPITTWVNSIIEEFAKNNSLLAAVQGTVTTENSVLGAAFLITSFGQLLRSKKTTTHMLTGNNSAYRLEDFLKSPFAETEVFHGPEVIKVEEIRTMGKHILLLPQMEVSHHFEAKAQLFIEFSIYWGWCFLNVRRKTDSYLPYRKLFVQLGILAPLALIPAKIAMDSLRWFQGRKVLSLGIWQSFKCLLFLYSMSIFTGYGAFMQLIGKKPKNPEF